MTAAMSTIFRYFHPVSAQTGILSQKSNAFIFSRQENATFYVDEFFGNF
jgi:hypothetical protein